MTVTVVSCVYGDRAFDRFIPSWESSVRSLERQPDDVIVTREIVGQQTWKHPQAYYLQRAIDAAQTDWVWILDIDDTAFPDALNGIDDVAADVWAMGYVKSDGETYIPPPMTATDVFDWPTSLIPGASAFRTEAFRGCGGFSDVAFQDWALWRSLAAAGAEFAASGRVHYRYNRHPATRSVMELTAERRAEHMAEMEAVHA